MSSVVLSQNIKKNKPQILSIFGIPYIRILTPTVAKEDVEELKRKFLYVFIYSYSPLDLPDFALKEQTTAIIDLTQSLDDIFAKFRKNTRNEIRKMESTADITYRVPDTDLNSSYSLYKRVKRKDDKVATIDIKEDFKGCLFFNAYQNKTLVVSMSCYDNGTTLRLKHIVSRRKEEGFNSYIMGAVSRKLIWEICKYGKNIGRTSFDLAGTNLADSTKSGVTMFKQSFGGEQGAVYIYRYERRMFTLVKKLLHLVGMNIN